MEKLKVGIMGGAGYTGGEVLRVLLNHDQVEVVFVQSRSQVGQPVHKVHSDLRGVTSLSFTDDSKLITEPSLKAIFLGLPHGEARKFLEETKIPDHLKVIDLSHDFRLKAASKLGADHFVYGLPELRREEIMRARLIANPGCFATAIQLALLPLAKAKKLGSVSVTGVTGATGAGQKPTETSHFSFRVNNVQAYKTLTHQHVAEVEESLRFLQGDSKPEVSFIPWRGDFPRGIFVSALVDSDLSGAEALKLYQDFYKGNPFVAVTDEPINLKSVLNTNRGIIEIVKEGKKLAIHCAIDNLLKGAAGQAVQNFNLMMGLPEMSGLKLKGAGF